MQARDMLRTSVLLVDDQPSDLVAMERHLAPFELHLVKALSGEEALEHYLSEDFALVLMDVRMPGISGIETARRMRQTSVAPPPLIFLTGAESGDATSEHGYESGGVDWLSKPVEPQKLRAKVRVFVELHREREARRMHEAARRDREREVLEGLRKRGEEECERLVGELREAVRLRDEFLSVASHEMKTPLTPLALRLQLMRQELDKPEVDVPRLRGHVEAARAQVRRMASLMDGLLDTTRITRGQLKLRREQDINFAAVLRDVVAQFADQAARASCPLEMELPARVLGQWDPLRLEQIVAHLMSNALKFGAGGTIHLRLEEQQGWARLTVRDEGFGMDAALCARIFDRFERGVSERHYGGLGLGLFLTRQITEAMGGRIQVESAPGLGATFTVELPCTPGGEESGGAEHGT